MDAPCRPRPPRQPKTAAENCAISVKGVGDKCAKEGKWPDARDEYAKAISLVLDGSAPTEGWAWDLLPRLLCNRAIALYKCGVQFDMACVDAMRAADALKVHLHSDAQPGGAGSKRAEQLKLLTKARFWEARALTRLDPPRLTDACDALRKALATCHKRGDDGKSDARAAQIELRDVASKLPLGFVCEHWADAVAQAESPSPFATSQREGRLLKPVRPDACRMSKAELTAVLEECAVGQENEWRDEMVAAWVSASAAAGVDGDHLGGSQSSAIGGLGGRRAKFFLHSVRARAYMRRGRHEQALRDSRAALSYVPSSSEWELFDADAATPLRSLDPAAAHVPVPITETARRAAGARAMHAAALEAAGAVVNADELDVYHPEFNPCALDGDVDPDAPVEPGTTNALPKKSYDDVTKSAWKNSTTTMGEGGVDVDARKTNADRLHAKRTHLTTRGVGRVMLCSAGEGGRTEDLVVDSGVAAAVEWRRACALDPNRRDYSARCVAAAERHLPTKPRSVLLDEGAGAAVEWLEKEKWANAPEYVRPRSKYYYFYEWMRERITDHFPALPEPIMDKLLAMDAGELDLLLRYPKAIRGQVEEYLDVYRREGGKYLETYRTPQLSWEEVKALKGRDTIGLGPQNESGLMGMGVGGGGFDSCGNRIGPKKPMLLEDAEDVSDDEHTTDRAMLGAAGDEGLTEEEAAGLVMNNSATSKRRDRRLAKYPNLPPDAQRDAVHRREARAAGDSKFLVGNDRATKGLPQREIDPDTSRRVAAILGKDASPSTPAIGNAPKKIEVQDMDEMD